jgi:hypothetical protein
MSDILHVALPESMEKSPCMIGLIPGWAWRWASRSMPVTLLASLLRFLHGKTLQKGLFEDGVSFPAFDNPSV